MLPPAGGFLPPLHLLKNQGEVSAFLNRLPCSKQIFAGSATEALFHTLTYLREEHGVERLFCSAYTCPDIVAAARRACVSVTLCDCDPETLEMLPPDKEPSTGSVVLFSNLYGRSERRSGWSEYLSRLDLWVVDDRCQTVTNRSSSFRELSPREILLLSFGRGKGLCGIGGGCAIGEALSAEAMTTNSTRSRWLFDFIRASIYSLLESPWLYALPASCPGLGIGETHYQKDFALSQISTLQLRTAAKLAAEESGVREQNISRWMKALAGLQISFPASQQVEGLTRLPIFVSSERREHLLPKLRRLGVTASYPATLVQLCGADVSSGSFPGATHVSETLLTLPIHGGVKESDIEQAAIIFRSALL